jgi:hypothetical protein
VSVVDNGTTYSDNLEFATAGFPSVEDSGRFNFGGGVAFFTGSDSAPQFVTGTHGNLLDFNDVALGTITITDVTSSAPEPAAWALMLVGFAGLGGALRARRARFAAPA